MIEWQKEESTQVFQFILTTEVCDGSARFSRGWSRVSNKFLKIFLPVNFAQPQLSKFDQQMESLFISFSFNFTIIVFSFFLKDQHVSYAGLDFDALDQTTKIYSRVSKSLSSVI